MSKIEVIILIVVIATVGYYYYCKKNGKDFLATLKKVGQPLTKQDNTVPVTANVREDTFTAQDYLMGVKAIGTTFTSTPTMKSTGVDNVISVPPVGFQVNPSIPTMAQPPVSVMQQISDSSAGMAYTTGDRLANIYSSMVNGIVMYTGSFQKPDGTFYEKPVDIGGNPIASA